MSNIPAPDIPTLGPLLDAILLKWIQQHPHKGIEKNFIHLNDIVAFLAINSAIPANEIDRQQVMHELFVAGYQSECIEDSIHYVYY